MHEDPLSSLVVDGVEINKKLVAEVLAPYVLLDRSSGNPILLQAFHALKIEQKIVVYLLSRKAAISLGLRSGPEPATPKEIAATTGLNYDSVKPALSQMNKKRMAQNQNGAYLIPNEQVISIRTYLPSTPEARTK
jgi:hypothetical protein